MRPDEQVRERRGCGSDGPEGRPVSVLALDIVGFTEINGSLGAVCVARRVSNPLSHLRVNAAHAGVLLLVVLAALPGRAAHLQQPLRVRPHFENPRHPDHRMSTDEP